MVGDDISVGEFTTDAEVTRIVHVQQQPGGLLDGVNGNFSPHVAN